MDGSTKSGASTPEFRGQSGNLSLVLPGFGWYILGVLHQDPLARASENPVPRRRCTMTFQAPTLSQLRSASEKLDFHMTDSDLESFLGLMAGAHCNDH